MRLDPSDERLHALRLDDPTSNDASYRTELNGQVLTAAAFGGLPVVPRQRHPVTVGSERKGTRAFYWGLWHVPASYPTVRSFLADGVRNPVDARTRDFLPRVALPASRVPRESYRSLLRNLGGKPQTWDRSLPVLLAAMCFRNQRAVKAHGARNTSIAISIWAR